MICINIDKKTATISIQDNKFQAVSKDCQKWLHKDKILSLNDVITQIKKNL